jgi:glutamate-1-semialdehyde 2,1-aminomutase
MGALSESLARSGLPAQVIGVPPLFDVVFADGAVSDYRGTLRGDAEMGRRFTTLLRERGVLKGDSKYYVSLAHDAADVKHTCEAWASALDELAAWNKGRR